MHQPASQTTAETADPTGVAPYPDSPTLSHPSSCLETATKAALGQLPRRKPFLARATLARTIGLNSFIVERRVRGHYFSDAWRMVIPSDVDRYIADGPAYMSHAHVEELIHETKARPMNPRDKHTMRSKVCFAV